MLNKGGAITEAPLFIKEWLEYRGLSVAKAAEILGIARVEVF
jgi:predicted XRE-type DNA-binding protein